MSKCKAKPNAGNLPQPAQTPRKRANPQTAMLPKPQLTTTAKNNTTKIKPLAEQRL